MRAIVIALSLLSLVGCTAQPKSAAPAAQAVSSTPPPAGAEAVTAGARHEILELTNQKLVYECPKCGMTFDAPGTCSMGDGELVATQVDYSCPQDGKAVEQGGQCPRCPMNARVRKTTLASAATSDHR